MYKAPLNTSIHLYCSLEWKSQILVHPLHFAVDLHQVTLKVGNSHDEFQ